MAEQKFPSFNIGNLFIKKGIVQGGMGVGVSMSRLASAVAREGGVGVISAVGAGSLKREFKDSNKISNSEALKREIMDAKLHSDGGVIGVNIMHALSDFDLLVKSSIEAGVDIIFVGAGLFLKLPDTITLDQFKERKFAPIVSSSRAANLILRSWEKRYNHIPDAIVVEGPKAGGHLGFKTDELDKEENSLDRIVSEVVDIVKPFAKRFGKKIPIIAGGGLHSGDDIHRVIESGADGVQLGSRFVATDECDASDQFKEAFVKCKKEDITIINSPLGLPGRAIKSSFLKSVFEGKRSPISCPWKCIKHCDYKKAPYCIGNALLNSLKGRLEQGFAFCGANGYKIDRIISVKELFSTLEKEFVLA